MLRFLLLRYLPLPKVIGPKTHRMVDYVTIGAFLGLGALWWKDKRRASIAALANGLFVLGYVPFTDYDGNGEKPIAMFNHKKLDRIQVAMSALAPKGLGFEGEPQARPFHVHALNQTLLLGMTRVEESEQSGGARKLRRRKRAA